MIIRAIHVRVKRESIDAFKSATVKNHTGSLTEPGVLRFDVLQSADDPSMFLLYEVYRDVAATLKHKETPHYAEWKERVASMMDGDRTSAVFNPVAPDTEDGWIS